jgi:hypothetical protein
MREIRDKIRGARNNSAGSVVGHCQPIHETLRITLMSRLDKGMTIAGSIGALVCLLGVLWALMMPDILAPISHIRGKSPARLWAEVGSGLAAISPFLGVIAGWAILRGHRRWRRQIAAVAAGAVAWAAILCLGFWLIWSM